MPTDGSASLFTIPPQAQAVPYNGSYYFDYIDETGGTVPSNAIYVGEMQADGTVIDLVGSGIQDTFPHNFSGWDRIVPLPINTRLISVQDFRDRFTDAETNAFIDATRTDDNVAKLQFKLATAQEPLDLDGLALQQGMFYLAAIGVITEARRVEILS